MRRLVLSIGLAVALSALCASPALAALQGAQKASIYGPLRGEGCGTPVATEKALGFVVFNTPGKEKTLTGEVALKGAAPNATYVVQLLEGGSGLCNIAGTVGQLDTNGKGNGNLEFSAPRNGGFGFPKSAITVVREISELNFELLESEAVELD